MRQAVELPAGVNCHIRPEESAWTNAAAPVRLRLLDPVTNAVVGDRAL